MKSNQALDRAALLLAQPKKGFRANRDIPLYLLILPGFLFCVFFSLFSLIIYLISALLSAHDLVISLFLNTLNCQKYK